jgi:hypothetical protein
MTKTSSNEKGKMLKEKSSQRREVQEHAAVSLESFAQRKGHVRALEEFHKRKLRKRMDTAKALRKYRKVMRQEGYDAGQGASRKRIVDTKVNDEIDDIREIGDVPAPAELDIEETNISAKTHKPKKSNPFQKSLKTAKNNKLQAEQHQTDRVAREKERQKKLQERKKLSKVMTKRTRKGQPVMKHRVENLLMKLQKQQEETHGQKSAR